MAAEVKPPATVPARRQVEQPGGWDMHSPRAESTADVACSEQDGILPPATDTGTGPPVTVTIQQRVEQEQVQAFLEWTKGITSVNEQFDGFISTTVLREPIDDDGGQLFITIIKYSNFASARRWNQSPERKAWLEKLEAVGIKSPASGPATIDFSTFPVFTGLMSLREADPAPTRWRMWLLIWFQVYVLVEFFELVLPALIGAERWSGVNLHLKFLLGTFCTTVTIEWLTHTPVCWLCTQLGYLPDASAKPAKLA